MHIVTNEPKLRRNRLIAQVLFFISLAVLIGGLVIFNLGGRTNEIFFYAPCIVMPLGLATTIFSIRLTNQYVRLPHPEVAIREGLRGINKRSVLYNYVLPVNHILVAPQGVFSLTTRFQESYFKVEGDTWFSSRARGPLAPISLFLKQEALGEPFKQAEKDAQTVQAIIDKAIPNSGIKVQPVVVFTGTKAQVDVIDPKLPVVFAEIKKKPSLKSLLRDEKQRNKDEGANIVTQLQIEQIDEAFLSTLTDETREKQLVEED